MHAYSTDESRVWVYSVFAVVAVVVAWAISAATANLTWPQWVISVPSLAGVYTLAYKVFDEFGWRTELARKLRLVSVADIEGRYEGTLLSTFDSGDGEKVTKEVAFEVSQTWTKISIEMTVTSGSSSSRSISALGSVTQDGVSTKLVYIYRNTVHPGIADADMGDHNGAAELQIYRDGRLEGRYFNSRPRAGSISATKVDD